MLKKIIILASGNGSNFEAIVRYFKFNGKIDSLNNNINNNSINNNINSNNSININNNNSNNSNNINNNSNNNCNNNSINNNNNNNDDDLTDKIVDVKNNYVKIDNVKIKNVEKNKIIKNDVKKNKVEKNNVKIDNIEIILVSENKYAYVLKRAENLNIKSYLVEWNKKDRDSFFYKLEKIINIEKPDLIVLAGFMKIIPSFFVKKYKGKIINIHPSLLPAFKGVNAIEKAYNYGVKYTGVTVHFVDEGVDTGKIIEQEVLKIEEHDTLEKLEEKIHKIEHKLYPSVIERFLFKDIKINS